MQAQRSDMNRAGKPGPAQVPEGLVSAVVDLVGTGPVKLGAYTAAELAAVDAIVDFLEVRPPDDVLAEAVRSLAARELLVAGAGGGQMQVRGDLGIAVAFQQRARVVLDARVTGTESGEPWRTLLLPQPEPICLVVRIDALGIHELGLDVSGNALDQLVEWLPGGDEDESAPATDPANLLASAERSALVTVTRYTAQGSVEVAGASMDLVLAARNGTLHAFTRDPAGRATLVPRPLDRGSVRESVRVMMARAVG
jgi:hypothetical protein